MAYFKLRDDWRDMAKRDRRFGLPVELDDGSTYRVRRLLTEQYDNIKFAKSGKAGHGFYTVGLSLAPYTLAGVGNVCAKASPQCAASCLNTSGRGLVKDAAGRYIVQMARIAKTRAALSRDANIRSRFAGMLAEQIDRSRVRAYRRGLRLCVRLNVLSDLPWEAMFPELFAMFPDVQFYDYTKVYKRLGSTPANYDLTFSRSERNGAEVDRALRNGFRVAVVFTDRAPLPKTWQGYRVVDSDKHDLRFIEPGAVVCGLKAKGQARVPVGRHVPDGGFVVGA